jgi:hypothetical protein
MPFVNLPTLKKIIKTEEDEISIIYKKKPATNNGGKNQT